MRPASIGFLKTLSLPIVGPIGTRRHQDGAERMIAAAARPLEAAAQEFLVIKRRKGLGARLSEPGAASFRMNRRRAQTNATAHAK
jgi:hypothetical protein